MKKQFENYKVGDRVWDAGEKEWVEITAIGKSSTYPIDLSNGDNCAVDGKFRLDSRLPRYYCQPFEIPPHAFERPRPELEVDAKVLVWDEGDTTKLHRHFAEWDVRHISVFIDGKTSWTETKTAFYQHYEIPEDTTK